MIVSADCAPVMPSMQALHATFLNLLPRIEEQARFCFRHLPCPHKKAEAMAETVALAWKWFCRLAERGKDVMDFPGAFAALAARAVKSGRRAVGMEKTKDVMSPLAQRRFGFTVEPFSTSTRRSDAAIHSVVNDKQAIDAYEDRLKDNTVTPPPDAAAFRLDFPPFLGSLSPRDRAMAMFLSLGHSNKRTAAKFGVSPGRVTQLRQQWQRAWRIGQGEIDSGAERDAESMTAA